MTGIYDIYKAKKIGLASDFWTYLLGRKLRGGGGIKEYEVTVAGEPPLYCPYSLGYNLLDWSITGNTVQNGTPTPEQPVEVKGVGDKTENLLDISTIYTTNSTNWTIEWVNGKLTINHNNSYSSGIPKTNPIYLKGGTYILYFKCNSKAIDLYVNGSYVTFIMPSIKKPFTINDGDVIDFRFNNNNIGMAEYYDIMLNEGSEPLSYEPFGYKLPVVSRGKNLFDKSTAALGYEINSLGISINKSWFVTDYMHIHKLATIYRYINVGNSILLYDKDKNEIGRTQFSGAGITSVKINNPDCEYIRCNSTIENIDKYMISEEPITEFEPYRTPITTPLYLDSPIMTGERLTPQGREVEWGKLVLTGDEPIGRDQSLHAFRYALGQLNDKGIPKSKLYCTHFKSAEPTMSGLDGEISTTTSSTAFRCWIWSNGFDTLDSFKSFLKSEYNAGHPVIIWYQLVTPTTEPVEMPEIETLDGDMYIDTDTQVKPSAMSVTYKSSKPDNDMQAMISTLAEI